MECGLGIFVAFVTLIQSSCAQQSPDYGLSESQSAKLRGIIENQDQTLSANFYTVQPIFDLIEILSTTQKYKVKLKDNGISSLVTGALLTAKNASDYTFNSIFVIPGRDCYPAEVARNAAHGDLENVYAQINDAVELTISGHYIDIRTEFEVFNVESKKSLENFNARLYNAIRTCANTNNAETLAAIEFREFESVKGLIHATDAVFDAIKVFATGIPAEGDSVAVIPGIKVYRKRAKFALRNAVEQTYSPIRGLYISTQLNQPETATRLISDQYAQIVANSRYAEAAQIILDVIRGYLTRIKLGLSEACNDDSSALDEAQVETAASYKVGFGAVVESVPTTDPVTSTAAATASKFFNDFTENGTAAYYKAIRLARGQGLNYSETLEKMKIIEDELRATVPDLIRAIFNVVQLGSNSTVSELKNLQSSVGPSFLSYMNNILAEIRVMAAACHGIKAVSDEDFNAIHTARNHIGSLVGSFNSNLSSGHVALIKTDHPKIPTGVKVLTVRLGVGFTFN